jgi:hypothetical protein
MEYDDLADDPLTREELDELKPSREEMFTNTKRSTVWYNEAVWTAASLFVEAAQQSDTFRERFLSGETEWRSTLEKELPEYHEAVMGIGLSAAQGGFAEKRARSYIEDTQL